MLLEFLYIPTHIPDNNWKVFGKKWEMNSSQKFTLDWFIGWPFCTFLTKLLLKTDPSIPTHHVTPLNSWPVFHCIELYRDLQAYFQHLTSPVKTNDFNNNWTGGKILLNIPILESIIQCLKTVWSKSTFVGHCKIYTDLPTSPIFEVASWQKEQKSRSAYLFCLCLCYFQRQMLSETFIETLEMNGHLCFLKSIFPKYF